MGLSNCGGCDGGCCWDTLVMRTMGMADVDMTTCADADGRGAGCGCCMMPVEPPARDDDGMITRSIDGNRADTDCVC